MQDDILACLHKELFKFSIEPGVHASPGVIRIEHLMEIIRVPLNRSPFQTTSNRTIITIISHHHQRMWGMSQVNDHHHHRSVGLDR